MPDYPDDTRPQDSRGIEEARAAVRVPAVFVILNGLFGLAILGLLSVPLVFDPDSLFASMKDVIAQQPPGPQKQQMEQDIADAEAALNANRDGFVRQNAVGLGVGAALNLIAILGGIMMLSLSGYSLSMAGAVLSLVPCATGCFCTGIPFGLWALVVLVRPEVKAAYAARRNFTPPNPDDEYLR